jgi:UDP-GlcNAc:undecaprenyl-phosphate GlcNAc-1-phosphate transferase
MFVAFAVTLLVAGFPYQGLQARWNLLLAAALMFALGLYDDFKRISPPAKLLGQILAATLFIFFGDVIDFFPWPIANIILTFAWLVGITNAINLLDNMDGLAGGVALIAAGALSYFFWRAQDWPLLMISLALAGGILGFLVFNFPPARIFMGDGGSLFLGFTLSALAVARKTQASNVLAVFGVPIMLFLLPILDTSLVTITRLMRGQSPTQGGTDHTSHRLIAFGLSERQAVLVLYGVTLISGASAAALEAIDYDLSLILIPILLITLSLFTAYLGRLKVVTSTSPTQSNLARWMVALTYKRRLFEIGLDLVLIGVSYYLAYWIVFGLNMTQVSMRLFLRSWPVALVAAYLSFFVFGVYRGVWRYLSLDDLLRYVRATLGAVALAAAVLMLLDAPAGYLPESFLLYAIFLFLGLIATRFSFRFLDRLYSRQQTRPGTMTVLLYGAQDAGELALRWILQNPHLGYRPLGFIDDDPLIWGRSIHGVDVLGGREQLEVLLADKAVGGLILTAPIDGQALTELLEVCQKRGVWVRTLRLEFEPLQS